MQSPVVDPRSFEVKLTHKFIYSAVLFAFCRVVLFSPGSTAQDPNPTSTQDRRSAATGAGRRITESVATATTAGSEVSSTSQAGPPMLRSVAESTCAGCPSWQGNLRSLKALPT